MNKIKIFSGIKDKAFSEKLKELSRDVEIKEWPGPQPQFGRKAELDGFQRKAARRVEVRDGQNQMKLPPNLLI